MACPRSPTRRGRRRRSCNILRASDDDKKDTLGNLDSILASGDEEKEAAPAPETEKRVDDVSASPNRDFLFQRHDIS